MHGKFEKVVGKEKWFIYGKSRAWLHTQKRLKTGGQ